MARQREGSQRISYCLKRRPVIASLMSAEELPVLLNTSASVIFIVKSDIFMIDAVVERIREAGKLSFIHFDLIEGLGKDRAGLAYLADKVGADGIVTTKNSIIAEAKKLGLLTVQRLFVLDSVSLDNGIKIIKSSEPDAIEVLPGLVCKRIVGKIRKELDIPIIAGGLISEPEDFREALDSGVIGISTSSRELWRLQDEGQMTYGEGE